VQVDGCTEDLSELKPYFRLLLLLLLLLLLHKQESHFHSHLLPYATHPPQPNAAG
jgi:hypothetical protein